MPGLNHQQLGRIEVSDYQGGWMKQGTWNCSEKLFELEADSIAEMGGSWLNLLCVCNCDQITSLDTDLKKKFANLINLFIAIQHTLTD